MLERRQVLGGLKRTVISSMTSSTSFRGTNSQASPWAIGGLSIRGASGGQGVAGGKLRRKAGVEFRTAPLDESGQPVAHEGPEPVPAGVARTSQAPTGAQVPGIDRLGPFGEPGQPFPRQLHPQPGARFLPHPRGNGVGRQGRVLGNPGGPWPGADFLREETGRRPGIQGRAAGNSGWFGKPAEHSSGPAVYGRRTTNGFEGAALTRCRFTNRALRQRAHRPAQPPSMNHLFVQHRSVHLLSFRCSFRYAATTPTRAAYPNRPSNCWQSSPVTS